MADCWCMMYVGEVCCYLYYFSVHICHIYRYLFLSVIAALECGGNGRVYFFHWFSPALF